MWSFSAVEKAAGPNPSARAPCFITITSSGNGYIWETGRRAKSTRKNSTHRRFSPLLGNVYTRRQCYASRVEIAKQNFSSSMVEDFMICLKANSSACIACA